MGLKPMLLWHLPAVLSGKMLTVILNTSLLPHYSSITLLLEVLIHIWMLTYVFREIFYQCAWFEKKLFKFVVIDNHDSTICFLVIQNQENLNVFLFSNSDILERCLYLTAIRDVAVHNQNLVALGCKIETLGFITIHEFHSFSFVIYLLVCKPMLDSPMSHSGFISLIVI